MNEIDAWLACDDDGTQFFYQTKPTDINGEFFPMDSGGWWLTHGHDIQPGQCRPVKLRVEVVKDEN